MSNWFSFITNSFDQLCCGFIQVPQLLIAIYISVTDVRSGKFCWEEFLVVQQTVLWCVSLLQKEKGKEEEKEKERSK
jgi:hypothetical protein